MINVGLTLSLLQAVRPESSGTTGRCNSSPNFSMNNFDPREPEETREEDE